MSTLNALKDNDLREGAPTTNYGGAGSFLIIGTDGTSDIAIVAFDITGLSAVSNASLSFYVENILGCSGGRVATASRMLITDWTEGNGGAAVSNWNEYKTSTSWNTAGCGNSTSDYTTTHAATTTITHADSADTGDRWTFDIKDMWNDAVAASQTTLSIRISLAGGNGVYAYIQNRLMANAPYIEYTTGSTVTFAILPW